MGDLGITMSESGSFTAHIAGVVAKGNRMAGWIMRTFRSRDRNVLMPVYKQLVLSLLEYCCPLWSPCDAAGINSLERVQKAYTRRIDGIAGKNRPNYRDRLKILNIYSLERRRERYTIIYVWKILHNLVPNPGIVWSINDRTGVTIQRPKSASALRRNGFIIRGANLFNILPRDLRRLSDNPNVETFKNRLDKILRIVPDEPFDPKLGRAAASNSLIDQI